MKVKKEKHDLITLSSDEETQKIKKEPEEAFGAGRRVREISPVRPQMEQQPSMNFSTLENLMKMCTSMAASVLMTQRANTTGMIANTNTIEETEDHTVTQGGNRVVDFNIQDFSRVEDEFETELDHEPMDTSIRVTVNNDQAQADGSEEEKHGVVGQTSTPIITPLHYLFKGLNADVSTLKEFQNDIIHRLILDTLLINRFYYVILFIIICVDLRSGSHLREEKISVLAKDLGPVEKIAGDVY